MFKTSNLKENCLLNYCLGGKRRKRTNISQFPATHTNIKLALVSFFFPFPDDDNDNDNDIDIFI